MNKVWQRVQHWVRFIFSSIFGTWKWEKPRWWKFLQEKCQEHVQPHWLKLKNSSVSFCSQHKKELRWTAIGFVIAAILGIGGYEWYDHLPKPQLVKLSITRPAPLPLVENAVLSNLELNFDHSIAKLEQGGKAVDAGITMTPAHPGVWKWEADNHLVFVPKTEWPIDTKFQIQFDKHFFPSHVRLEDYSPEFHTEPFAIRDSHAEFYQHPENPKEKRVVAEIKVSHPVAPDTIKNKIKIEIQGNTEVLGNIPRNYNFDVTYDKFFGRIFIKSEILPLPLKDTTIKVTIDKGWGSAHGGNKIAKDTTVEASVPGLLTFFKIASSEFQFVENKTYELEQVIAVESSTEVVDQEFDKNFEVYLLPAEHKNPNNHVLVKNYIWNAGEVNQEVLSHSQKINFDRVPGEHPQEKIQTFKVQVPQNRSLYLKVKKGLKSFHEYVLAEEYNHVVRVKPFPREIKVLHEGSILSLSGDKKLSILTRGVKSIQVEVAHVLADQLNHLISQSYGNFANPHFQSEWQFNWDNITEKTTEIIDVAESFSGKPEFAAVDAAKYLAKAQGGGRGILFVRILPYNRVSKTTFGKGDQRFVMVTDLGVIEKKMADQSHDIFVQSIHSGAPIAGATVEVIGKNGLPVIQTKTDAQGRARVLNLNDFKNEKTALAFVIHSAGDTSFLPLNHPDRQLQYSRFDIGGVRTWGDIDRLQAYVFSDRGLYRPGESFHLASVVRSFDWKTQLDGVPVEWVVTDPKNQEIYKEKISLTRDGFVEMSSQTNETAFVGTYTGSLYIIKDDHRQGLLGSTTFRVEEFVPDRMKISAGFSVPETTGWVSPEGLKAWVRVMTLFGYPAENRKINAHVSLSPAYPTFPGYRDFSFFFPKTDKSYEEELTSIDSNDKGEAEFPLDFSKFEKGNYRIRFDAEAFEAEGGRSVAAQAGIMISPYKYFVGFKSDSDLSYIKLNTNHEIDYIAVDPNLKKTSVAELSIQVIEKQWVSVLTKQDNGTFKYESVQRDREVSKAKWKIENKGTKFKLPTEAPGDFKVLVLNSEGVEISHLEFSVVGQGNVLGKMDRNAELQIKLSRSDYSTGDEIEMQVKAPYVGAGLITIERDKVYTFKWFKTTSANSIQTIRVPEGLEGNAYINVAFLRDIGSKEIFMSPLSYGVVPFYVDLKKRQYKLDLKAPAEQRPGEPMKIEFSGNKPGKIIVFAVDEGILQVAKYQTPDPLKLFFQKRALEIDTYQLLDLVLPEFHIVKELSASGGDGAGALANNLNPFRRKGKPPVAYWSGLIDVGPGKHSVTYNVPDYFSGSLRVMAVAVSTDSIGVMRADTLVCGDFIITPTVPFVLTPGDEAVIGVSVFNNLKGSGAKAKVNLKVETSPSLEIIDGDKVDLEIAETKEVSTTLRVRAKDSLGVANVKFVASSGGASAKLTEDLSLRPLSPYRTQVWGGKTDKGKQNIELGRSIYPEFARQSVTVSYFPLTLAHGLLEYLTDFPYGCTEQLLSKAFPTLLLGDKPDFNFKPAQRENAFHVTISSLRQRQTSDGGFGLYSFYGTSVEFPSLYANHYFVEAKDRGYNIPEDLRERSFGYLRSFVNRTANSIYLARNTAYAIYLMARWGQPVGNEINTLVKEINASSFKEQWPKDIGAMFMASTFKLLHQDDLAAMYSKTVAPQKTFFSFYENYEDLYIDNAMLLYLAALHFPEKVSGFAPETVESFVKMIQENRYNTLNSSIMILAMEAWSKMSSDPVEVETTVTEIDAAGTRTPLVFPKALFPKVPFKYSTAKLEVESKASNPVFYQAAQSGFDRAEKISPHNDKIEIQREYRAEGGKDPVAKLKMGDELEVHIKVRSLDNKTYPNIAIVDLIPSGFEVVLERSAHTSAYLLPERKTPHQEAWQRWLQPLLPNAWAQEGESEVSPDAEEPEPMYDEEGNLIAPAGGNEGGPRATRNAPRGQDAEVPTLALSGSTLQVQFENPREDRVVIYATVTPNTGEFIYKIKATNRGTFKTPPAFAEDMYDKTIQSVGPMGSLTVEDNR